jgi:hypothetical protein
VGTIVFQTNSGDNCETFRSPWVHLEKGTKSKVQLQIQPGGLHSAGQIQAEQVQMEINSFLEAVGSYPVRAAEEPNLSFHQYLASFFVKARNTRASRSQS